MSASSVLHGFDNRARLDSFASELHALRDRVRAEMGAEDVTRLKRLHLFSHTMEVTGRVLIHVSIEPVTWSVGVLSLWIHKQLQATEIGHPVLHGCYDKLEGAEAFRSATFKWDIPIDEEAWRNGHNLRHHPYTNVTGRDPDIHFGPVRLNDNVPHRWFHYVQLPYTVFMLWPAFTMGMNSHFSGLLDVFRKEEDRDFVKERSWRSFRQAFHVAFRKYVPYYAKNYVLFPLLAGPLWWKVLLGNHVAEVMRDVYSALSIFCGHVGDDIVDYPPGTRADCRGRWYEMQCASTQNFQVGYVLSVLCGGLDYQIEHHLFPQLPPERLRQIAPEVQAICEAHGVPYRTQPWPSVIRKALNRVARLSFPNPTVEVTA